MSGERRTFNMAIIRAITLSLGVPHPLGAVTLTQVAAFLRGAQARVEAEGHTVQTTRVAARPILQDLESYTTAELSSYARELNSLCEAEGLAFVSLGPAPAHQPDFPLERLATLTDVLAPNPALNATVQTAYGGDAPRDAATLAAARIMVRLAQDGAGETNFRFAVLAMCDPGGPFFPQAYARGRDWSVSIGLQAASVVGEALACVAPDVGMMAREAAVRAALAAHARPVVELFRGLVEEAGYSYGGIDLSPAPMGADSIAAAMERAGLGEFGGSGTLALAAAITAGVKMAASDVGPAIGYNGLMLPVLEDEVLGQRVAQKNISATALLAYSAVCGTGLDTIPLPGATEPETVARLLNDVSTLAWRLRKPLSARLFLAPGVAAGEMTRFSSPYLTNTRVMSL
jgi:uncharacterized protein (UPF0210 family)